MTDPRNQPAKDGDDNVTWRDLYPLLDQVKTDLWKVKVGLIVLFVVTASPKVGGPAASQVVGSVLRHVSGT